MSFVHFFLIYIKTFANNCLLLFNQSALLKYYIIRFNFDKICTAILITSNFFLNLCRILQLLLPVEFACKLLCLLNKNTLTNRQNHPMIQKYSHRHENVVSPQCGQCCTAKRKKLKNTVKRH